MSSSEPAPPPSTPPRRPPPPHRSLLGWAFAVSFLLNLGFGIAALILCVGLVAKGVGITFHPDDAGLTEQAHSGDAAAKNKIAIVSIDGILLEGLLDYAHDQIDQAGADPDVKAVVLRIDSPGGTITASDDLHRRLTALRWGKDAEKKTQQKPLVVSMGSIAASGGYYIAMPAGVVYAERTTVTGSIGVYASFPNVKAMADYHGFKMETIKQGEIKDSGSPFAAMTDHEREVWQDMVDHAYRQFLDMVEDGRADVLQKGQLRERVTIQRLDVGPPPASGEAAKAPPGPLSRYRADGGVFTADEALDLKLIDKIGTLDDAVQDAAAQANLGGSYRAIEYQRRKSPAELLLGLHARQPASVLEPGRLANGLAPRLWYLAPGSELSGVLAGLETKPGEGR